MLHLNKTIIPNPDAPVALDAYGDEAGPGLVVYTVKGLERFASGQLQPMSNATLVCAYRGAAVSMPYGMLPAFVVSIGFRPLGRLERRERVKPRPEDFDLAAAVNDLGPRLRALREQTGLRIGEFARALRGSLPQLSRIELGEWQPDPPPSPGQVKLDAKVDAMLHPAGRCTCGGGGGGDCEWCKMDQVRAENDLMQHVLRLARAVDKSLREADHPVWPNQQTMHIVKTTLMQEMRVEQDGAAMQARDRRETAVLAARIADHLLACKFIEPGTGQDVERSLIFLLGAASE